MSFARLGLVLAFLLWAAIPVAAEAPKVVASIKPVHALVAAIMGEIGQPNLLVQSAGSPHAYALKPSEAAILGKARLVVWVGPSLENFLIKPLAAQTGGRLKTVELMRAPGLVLHKVRAGGVWDAEDDGHGHGRRSRSAQETERALEAAAIDPHIWLDPLNAIAMAAEIRAALAEIDPANGEVYRANAATLTQRLQSLHEELAAALTGARTIPFLVFHDAYQYFEQRYGLASVGSITISPERQPGARRLQEVRSKIAKLKPRCVFSEPQFEPALISTVIEGSNLRTGVLDPLGSDLAAGPDAYPALLRRLADALNACLSGTS